MDEINKLKEKLMVSARELGICAPGYELMRGYDRDGLIGYYVANPDWCMERGFPDLQTLTESFSECGNKGVYVNKKFHGRTFSKLQTYVFHNCTGEIKVAMDYENAVIPMLYFANGCNMTVRCEQSNTPSIKVPVYVTDDSHNCVKHEDTENCQFIRHTIKLIEK